MTFNLQPILENDILILRPLQNNDFENLFKVASDPLIWEQHPAKERSQRDGFAVFFNEAIAMKSAFAIIDKQNNEIIGSTRFNAVEETQNAIEIGWSFMARQYWGGFFNKSVKKLLMDYAYDYVENVLFYIHENNIRSQKAVEKIGGTRVTHLENQLLDTKGESTVIYKVAKK
jgi:N-acetyltransferase